MSKKTMGLLLAAGGVVVLVVCVFAEQIGIGQSGSGFGYKQVAGTIAGAVALLAGTTILRAGKA